ARSTCRSGKSRRIRDYVPARSCPTSPARPRSSKPSSSSVENEEGCAEHRGSAVLTSIKRIAAVALFALAAHPASAETSITFAGYTGLFQDLYTKAVIDPFM